MEQKQLPAQLHSSSLQIHTIDDAKTMGNLFSLAGLFKVTENDAAKGMTSEQKEAINAVKLIIGHGLGLTPFESMKLHIVKDKVTVGYQQVLALVRRTPGYDYKLKQNTIECAEVEFFRNGESLGVSKFDTEDMQRSGGGAIWQRFPSEMRLSKAVSKGVNACCPEIFGGSVYTPQDLDNNSAAGLDLDVEVVAEEKKPRPVMPVQGATTIGQTPVSVKEKPPAKKPTATSAPAAAAATTGPATATPSAPVEQPPSEEVTDVQVIQGERPTFNDLGTVVEAGADNGWTPETIEAFAMRYFADNGVDCTSEETIAATWTWDHINALIDYVTANIPDEA